MNIITKILDGTRAGKAIRKPYAAKAMKKAETYPHELKLKRSDIKSGMSIKNSEKILLL